MTAFQPIADALERFLSPELRKLEPRELIRARLLAFALLMTIPCGFLPTLLLRPLNAAGGIWMCQGISNLVVAIICLLTLRKAVSYHRIAMFASLWLHLFFVSILVTLPTLFSVIYLWCASMIVFSGLMLGMRGALWSSAGLTFIIFANILYQYEQNTAWMSLTLDQYVDQILLGLIGSTVLTATVTGVYEFMRSASDHDQARQRLIAARHAHTGAVGELVGHVAHEVNNPLAILQGSVMRLRRHLERGSWHHEAHKLLGNMQSSHARIIRVQQALAVFASGNQREPFVSHDLRSIFRDVQLAMLPQAQVQQVQLEFQVLDQPLRLRCQPHQLVYVLCSLIQNSLEACRDHASPHIVVVVQKESDLLLISISDNGKGIEKSAQERIFEPFFTTKKGGHAQGLSLSVSRGILTRHGGDIHFKSLPGATTFMCVLPRDAASDLPLSKGA